MKVVSDTQDEPDIDDKILLFQIEMFVAILLNEDLYSTVTTHRRELLNTRCIIPGQFQYGWSSLPKGLQILVALPIRLQVDSVAVPRQYGRQECYSESKQR